MKVHVDSKTKEIEKREMIWAACKQEDQNFCKRKVMDDQNIILYLPFHAGQQHHNIAGLWVLQQKKGRKQPNTQQRQKS